MTLAERIVDRLVGQLLDAREEVRAHRDRVVELGRKSDDLVSELRRIRDRLHNTLSELDRLGLVREIEAFLDAKGDPPPF